VTVPVRLNPVATLLIDQFTVLMVMPGAICRSMATVPMASSEASVEQPEA
jgi:hypothetical protein